LGGNLRTTSPSARLVAMSLFEYSLKALIAALMAVSLIFPRCVGAQAQPDAEAVAAATELITTLRLADQFKVALPAILRALKPVVGQGRPETEREFDAVSSVVLDAMNARVSELMGPLAAVYARNFTVSEMRQLVAFYRTPTGQKFLDKQAVVTEEATTISQNIGRTIAGEMHGRIIEEMRKRAQKL
jgi:uncharacterized protein